MKLLCDCGNEIKFEEGVVPFMKMDGSISARYDYDKIEIVYKDNKIIFICKNCSKKIRISI